MSSIIPDSLYNILMISAVFSSINMIILQKVKSFEKVTLERHINIINVILSFLIGIPFSMHFYGVNYIDGIFVGLFSFVGAPLIYETLKTQNIVNYTPKKISDFS